MIDYYIVAVDPSEFENKILEWGDTIHLLETNTTVSASTSIISFPGIFLLLIILVTFRLRISKF